MMSVFGAQKSESDDFFENIKKLEAITKLTCIQRNGQRIFCPQGQPLSNWPEGTEVVFLNFPPHKDERMLFSIFIQFGEIRQTRLMISPKGTNRRLGFIVYADEKSALRAVQETNGKVLNFVNSKHPLCVSLSRNDSRLFVGRIPQRLTKSEIQMSISRYFKGLKEIFYFKDWENPNFNRGFCFVQFDGHENAVKAKCMLVQILGEIWKSPNLVVTWAKPEYQARSSEMSKVKKIFIRGLLLTTTAESLRNAVQERLNLSISTKDVRKQRDYAFIAFDTRNIALKAIRMLDGYTIDGVQVEVMLARPAPEQLYHSNPQHDWGSNFSETFQTTSNEKYQQFQEPKAKDGFQNGSAPLLENAQMQTYAALTNTPWYDTGIEQGFATAPTEDEVNSFWLNNYEPSPVYYTQYSYQDVNQFLMPSEELFPTTEEYWTNVENYWKSTKPRPHYQLYLTHPPSLSPTTSSYLTHPPSLSPTTSSDTSTKPQPYYQF